MAGNYNNIPADNVAFDAMKNGTKSKADNMMIKDRKIRRDPVTRESFSLFGKEDLDYMTKTFGKEEFTGTVKDWKGRDQLRGWSEELGHRGYARDSDEGFEIENILKKAQKRGTYNFDQVNKEGGFGTLGNPVAFNERYMDEQFKKHQSSYLQSVGKVSE